MNRRARFYRLDMASPRLAHVFCTERPRIVFVFAAIPRVQLTIKDPMKDAEGILGIINVLENSVRIGAKKVVYSSSGFIYGNAKRVPVVEREPFQPLAPYNISKFACENYLRFFHSYYGLDYVILRYATVYGPRQTSGAMLYYIQTIKRNRPPEIYGKKTRDYIFISDVVRANLAAVERATHRVDPVFNIAVGRETRIEDLCGMIAATLGKPMPKLRMLPSIPGEVDRYFLDTRKARRVLSFRPRVPLPAGLKKTIAWLSE